MIGWSFLGCVVRLIVWLTSILDISNIARIGISNIVVDNLGAAVWKSNPVFAIGGISIPVLVLGKVDTGVVICYSIAILVDSWCVI